MNQFKVLIRDVFPLAILAGICISIGYVVNLRVGGVAGAVLFAFYFLVSPREVLLSTDVLWLYIAEVLGNFVGCNLYRWTTVFTQQ